ncbi:MAG: putative toxin-antitoxin system toxin component, PIN family [Candidatus Andersenbacteria bacterium]|nr:putative toxin-antitoxin system toxin component, PIN family [bacterium]MDZ4225452.1 putative toxin-antitoxin system toxin component, PIN family [Candidatus Andersenbacteria bacterium]
MRIILDTNVLIDAYTDDFTPQAKIINAAINGRLTACYTLPIEREYQKILRRLISNPPHRQLVSEFINHALLVAPGTTDIQVDDNEDVKFLQAAADNNIDLIITNDRHLLDVGQADGTKIVTPAEAWTIASEEIGDNQWNQWTTGLGL